MANEKNWKVVTTTGVTAVGSGTSVGGPTLMTKDQAERTAAQMNAKADMLGIKTRYEIKQT